MNNIYTVACWLDGIYAGIMKPTRDDGTKQWKVKSECTNQAIDAVMRYMLSKAKADGTPSYAVQWTDSKGKTITLRLEVEQ